MQRIAHLYAGMACTCLVGADLVQIGSSNKDNVETKINILMTPTVIATQPLPSRLLSPGSKLRSLRTPVRVHASTAHGGAFVEQPAAVKRPAEIFGPRPVETTLEVGRE